MDLKQQTTRRHAYPVPVHSELTEPVECCHIVTSCLDQLLYDVTSVHLYSDQTYYLQTLYLSQVCPDGFWELIQHSNLSKYKHMLYDGWHTNFLLIALITQLSTIQAGMLETHAGGCRHLELLIKSGSFCSFGRSRHIRESTNSNVILHRPIFLYLFTFETLESFLISPLFSRGQSFSYISSPLHLRGCDTQLQQIQRC